VLQHDDLHILSICGLSIVFKTIPKFGIDCTVRSYVISPVMCATSGIAIQAALAVMLAVVRDSRVQCTVLGGTANIVMITSSTVLLATAGGCCLLWEWQGIRNR
jgi:hypothetical protein